MTNNKIEEKWFAVYSDLTLKEFELPNKEENVIYWLLRTFEGKTNTTSYGNTFEIYNYSIYDKLLNATKIEVGNWKCLSIKDPLNKNNINSTTSRIADPRGRVKDMELSWDENAVPEVLNTLNKYSKYKSWEEYEIITENDSLKEQNKTLRDENVELRNKIKLYEQFLKDILKDLPNNNIKKLSNYDHIQQLMLEQKLGNLLEIMKMIWKFDSFKDIKIP